MEYDAIRSRPSPLALKAYNYQACKALDAPHRLVASTWCPSPQLYSGQAFLSLKGPWGGGGSLRIQLMISETIQGSQIKLCTVITTILKAYQNTKRKFQRCHIWHHNDIITKTIGKFGPLPNHAMIHHLEGDDESFRKCVFSFEYQVMAI